MTIDPNKLRDAANIEVLMGVPLRVTAELGTAKMSVAEVL